MAQKSPQQTLAQAEMAAQQGDWGQLSDCLQQLLLQEAQQLPSEIGGADSGWLEQLLPLALQGLEFGDFQVRWEIAKVVPNLGKGAIAPLIDYLQDPDADAEVQWFVIRILGQFPHPEVIPTLINLLKLSQDEELNSMAIAVLANLGNDAISVLGELLNDPSTRLLATQALTQIRDVATVPWLLTVVNDQNAHVRQRAIEAVGSFPDPSLVPVLLAALTDPVAAVRCAAVIALGFCSDGENSVAQLRPLLLDLDLAVTQQTAIALSRIGTPTALSALYQVLQSPSTPEPLTLEVVRALVWIEQSQALQYLQQALMQLPFTTQVRQEILAVLGRVQVLELKAQATQILLDVLEQEPDFAQLPNLKQTIALSLGQLGQPAALTPLIQLLTEPNPRVRLHVIAALKTLDAPTAYQHLQQLAQNQNTDPDLARGVAIALQEW